MTLFLKTSGTQRARLGSLECCCPRPNKFSAGDQPWIGNELAARRGRWRSDKSQRMYAWALFFCKVPCPKLPRKGGLRLETGATNQNFQGKTVRKVKRTDAASFGGFARGCWELLDVVPPGHPARSLPGFWFRRKLCRAHEHPSPTRLRQRRRPFEISLGNLRPF